MGLIQWEKSMESNLGGVGWGGEIRPGGKNEIRSA